MVAATSPTGRHFKPENYENYKLCRKAFATCCADMNTLLCVYGSTTLKKGESCPFSLDAFTDKNTAQLDHFWTSEMDAFSQDWQGSILWVHPPYSMADLVLQKIKETPNFTGCVFLPEWFSEDWFLEYMDCCTTFRSFHSTDGMFTLHGKHPQTRPNWNCTAFYFIDYQPDQTKLDFVLEGQLESPIEDVAITTSLKVTPLFISTITVILGNTNLQLRALWDGGATDSLIHTSVANTHFSQYIEPTLKLLAGYSAESEERPQLTEGQIRPLLKINAKNKYITVKHSLLLTDLCNLYDVLIGRNLMKRLRAVEDYEKETITLSPMDDKVLRITPDPISRITSVSTVTDEQPETESSTPYAAAKEHFFNRYNSAGLCESVPPENS